MLTREPEAEAASLGEVIWVRHVLRLHDDRGSLVASVSHELAGSPWLGLVTAVLRRAWEGEDEDDVLILFPDGTSRRAADLLPEEPILRAPSLGLASRDVIMGDET